MTAGFWGPVLAIALAVGAANDGAAIDEALRQRDSFEHDRAIQTLRDAADAAENEEAAAPFLWHLGALLAESRRVDEAKAAFKRAAATGVKPRLRIVVAPSIQALIDEAVAAAPRPPPAPDPAPLDDGDRLEEELPRDDVTLAEEPPPVVEPEPGAGLGALGVGGVVVGALGAVAVAAGAVVWGFGLAEHAAATSATSQGEADAHNQLSAPLQVGGQVTVASGAAVGILGAVLFFVDGGE